MIATRCPFSVGLGRIHYFSSGGTFVASAGSGGAAVIGGGEAFFKDMRCVDFSGGATVIGSGEAVAPDEATFLRTRMAGGIKSQSGNSFARGETL